MNKTNLLRKTAQSINSKRTSKTVAICLSALFLVSMLTVLATTQAATPSLSGAYWITPVPADQSTGRVTQTETSGGTSGYIPGDCYGAYPTVANRNGYPYWDLSSTPILSFDIYVNEFWQGDLRDHTGLSILIIDATNNGWNPSPESACDLSTTYGHSVITSDGSIMRVADSASPTHYEIDLRTLHVPLNHVSQIIWSIRPGMKGVASSYEITNIQISATGGISNPLPTASPTPAPTVTPTQTSTSTPNTTPTPTADPTPTQSPPHAPTPRHTHTTTAYPTIPHYNWWWSIFSWNHASMWFCHVH